MKTREISGWITVLAVLLVSCKTTKHLQKKKTETHQVQKVDSTGTETAKKVTEEHAKETFERNLDTSIKPPTINVQTKAPAPKKGKVDSTAVYDSLGNKLGTIATSLDSQTGALNIGLNLQPPNVNANIHEKATKEGNKKTTEDNTKSTALHSSNQVDSTNEKANKDVVRKTDVWAWIRWIAAGAAVLLLFIFKGHIWTWLKKKIKK